MTPRLRLCCWSSVLLCLAPLPATAAWRVERQLLEASEPSRVLQSLVVFQGERRLSRLEGSGRVINDDPTVVFDLPLGASAMPRELEWQVGYLRTTAGVRPESACAIDQRFDFSSDVQTVRARVPLRSIDPAAETLADLATAYDYLAPAQRLIVPRAATRVRLTVERTERCRDGTLVVLHPKLWQRVDDVPGKTFILLASDSISADWFKPGMHFMPATTAFFSGEHGRFVSNVVSIGSNTHDTTFSLMNVAPRLRDVSPTLPAKQGLLPTFERAGYDVQIFSSNLLLSSAFAPFGAPYLYTLEVHGSEVNERNPELMTALVRDWLERHPDHDAMFFMWFDATHVDGVAPTTRADLSLAPLPYPRHPRQAAAIELQARSISYVDTVLERFFAAPVVRRADIVFFADHGVNFDTLKHPSPLWGGCTPTTGVANWHLAPVEVLIPVGAWTPSAHLPNPKVETGLLDWVKTVAHAHNPALDLASWQAHDLAEVTAATPLITMGHGKRGAIRIGGEHTLFSSNRCSPLDGLRVFADDGAATPAPRVRQLAMSALSELELAPVVIVQLDVLTGASPCTLTVTAPAGARRRDSSPFTSQHVGHAPWFERVEIVVVESEARDITLSASPAGCAVLDQGLVSRVSPSQARTLAQLGLVSLALLPATLLHAATEMQVSLHVDATPRLWRGSELVVQQVETDTMRIGADVRSAMKKWGYIQDDH